MLPLTTVALFVFAAFCAGLVDAIAGGGGLITVPVLLAARMPLHLALGTNKGQAAFGATSSFVSFWTRGGIDRDRAFIAFVSGAAGSLSGAALLMRIKPEPLRPVIIALLVGAAAVLLLKDRLRVREQKPSWRLPRLLLAAVGFGLGAYDGFFGPGVGSMLIIAFVLLFGDSLTRASGNAKVVNWASNLAALGLFAWRGNVLWGVALPMAAANALGAFIGARLALKHGDRFVRVVVLIVVSALVIKLAWDLVHHRA